MSKLPFPYENLVADNEKETDKHWFVHCCFHAGDEGASMCINKTNPYKLNFKCFACGKYGSPKQFAKEMKLNPNFISEYVMEKDIKKPKICWEDRLKHKIAGFHPELILAENIGVGQKALRKFNIAINKANSHYLIPMYQGVEICGIQEQWIEKNERIKKSQRYSHQGWFVPDLDWDTKKPIYICEGFSDTTVLVDMGFQAIGRYNAAVIKPLVGIKDWEKVIIISDNDKVGLDGSKKLQSQLLSAIVAVPARDDHHYKDVRDMYLTLGSKKVKRWLERLEI